MAKSPVDHRELDIKEVTLLLPPSLPSLGWKKGIKVYDDQDSSPGWWHSPRHQTPSPLYVSITNLRSHNSKAGEEKNLYRSTSEPTPSITISKDYQPNSLHNRGISLYLLSIRNHKNGMKKSQEDMSKVLLQ